MFGLVTLLMCRQDVLEAITSEGSNWSRARQIEIPKVNMLSFQIFKSDEKGIQSPQKRFMPHRPSNRITRILMSQVEEAIGHQARDYATES